MKATGIVRRIDDLGRVVIPKEIRRTMRIREGDPLEIYTDTDGQVIFKKYSPMGELSEFAAQICDALHKTTGGMGYIGSHTCVELLEQGMDVVVVDNLVNSSAEAGRRVEQITGRPLKFYQMDVRDRAGLDRIFTEQKIDCVIHFAGLKAVGESVQMPLEYYDNNLGSTITLCEAMRDHGVRQIIFSSSATVYSGDNEMPLYETSRTGNCTNPYGWTKYVCEQILRDYVVADPSWSVVLLRYFNPIGAHPSGLIGEDPRGVPNNLMPYISQTAIGRLKCLSVFGDDYDTPDGTGVS